MKFKLFKNSKRELTEKIEILRIQNQELRRQNALLKEKLTATPKPEETDIGKAKESASTEMQCKLLCFLKEIGRKNVKDLRRENCKFSVYPIAKDDQIDMWAVDFEYCRICGCSIPIIFDNEISARTYALVLTKIGRKPNYQLFCSECYDKYIKSQIR